MFICFFLLPPSPCEYSNYYVDKLDFSVQKPHKFHHAGLRIIAPPNRVFTPGFFCRLIVTVFATLNVSIDAHLHFPSFLVLLFWLFLKHEDHQEGTDSCAQQRDSSELSRDVLGSTAREDVETRGLHRGAAISEPSRPWVPQRSRPRVDQVLFYSMYALVFVLLSFLAFCFVFVFRFPHANILI